MRILAIMLLLLLSGPTLAEEASIRAFFASQMPGYTLVETKQAGNWALCHWAYGQEAEGMALLRRLGQGWEVATSGGGAMGPGEMAQFGVPRSRWEALLGSLPAEVMRDGEASMGRPAWTWMTQKKKLTNSDLEGKSAWELTLMRNEIFAVHGRPFTDKDLRAYFGARPWYKARSNYSDSSLSALERANAGFISDYQRRTGKL